MLVMTPKWVSWLSASSVPRQHPQRNYLVHSRLFPLFSISLAISSKINSSISSELAIRWKLMRRDFKVESGINFTQWRYGTVTKQFRRVILPLWAVMSPNHAVSCHVMSSIWLFIVWVNCRTNVGLSNTSRFLPMLNNIPYTTSDLKSGMP